VPPQDRERKLRRAARSLLVESLAGSTDLSLSEALPAMAAIATPPVLVAWLSDRADSPLVIAATVVAMAVSVVLVFVLRLHFLAAWRISRMKRIGHGFDVDRYIAILSERRPRARLRVELRFARPWEPEEKELATKGLAELAPKLHVTWPSRFAVRLESEVEGRDTYVDDDANSTEYFTNRKLHELVMTVAWTVVPRLECVQKVEGFHVEVTGKTVPLDAKA
jgi:hypothetical protein